MKIVVLIIGLVLSGWLPPSSAMGKANCVDHVISVDGLSEAEQTAILGGTAAGLLGIS